MNTLNEILRALGRIEGELVLIRRFSERLSTVERMQGWLQGAWAVLLAAFAYLLRALSGK